MYVIAILTHTIDNNVLLCMYTTIKAVGFNYLIKTEVTKSVAIRPRQAKTTAAMGSGSPQRTYCTGIGSQPEGYKEIMGSDKRRQKSSGKICVSLQE